MVLHCSKARRRQGRRGSHASQQHAAGKGVHGLDVYVCAACVKLPASSGWRPRGGRALQFARALIKSLLNPKPSDCKGVSRCLVLTRCRAHLRAWCVEKGASLFVVCVLRQDPVKHTANDDLALRAAARLLHPRRHAHARARGRTLQPAIAQQWMARSVEAQPSTIQTSPQPGRWQQSACGAHLPAAASSISAARSASCEEKRRAVSIKYI